MEIRIRVAEGDDTQPLLLWDTQWNPQQGMADWVPADKDDIDNPLGLRARHALHTTVILCLFTWARVEKYEITPGDDSDRKGWWGDAVDVQGYETNIGSKLWLLLRSVLNESVRRRAEDYARQALKVLVRQRAVARVNVSASMDTLKGLLGLTVQLFSQDGTKVYDQRFDIIWRQEFRQ
jgi:phage gp46-like protein